MARITVKTLGEVSEVDRGRLEELTNRGWTGSGMREDVLESECNTQAFNCFIAREEGWIVGWAVAFAGHRSVSQHRPLVHALEGDEKLNVYFYVDPDQQRQGIGRHLMRRVVGWLRKHNAKGMVFAWDGASTDFFSTCLDRIENARDILVVENDI